MNILILRTQVPFVSGGAEVLVDGLASAISDRGHDVDIVALPLSWNPVDQLLTSALSWRLLDLVEANGRRIDRVICTKYPTWAMRHPNKSLWLVHQHRQAYDLHGTSMSDFTPNRHDQEVRRHVTEIDRVGIGECDRRYAISRNVSERLRRHTGLDAVPLYPPVPRTGLRPIAYEPFILSVARLDGLKRVENIVEACRYLESDLRLVIAGDGPNRQALESLVDRYGLGNRVTLLGRVGDDELRDLYNTCRAVYYAPIDEDYGYTTVEALAAGKPVITGIDSGAVLEFVADGKRGMVTSLEPGRLAEVIDGFSSESFAKELGKSGPESTAGLTWDTVVDALLGEPA